MVILTIGRALITAGLLGAAAILMIATAGTDRLVPQAMFQIYKLVWVMTPLALMGGWLLGIFHWGTRYSGADRTRRRWGVAVILGMFIGSAVYWWLGARPSREGNS